MFAPLTDSGLRVVIASYRGEPVRRWGEFCDFLAQELAVTPAGLPLSPDMASP